MTGDDDGSAVVEFVLVSIIVIALLLALVQLAMALYVRNTLVADAQEGAHYAAASRQPMPAAVPYTQALIARTLPANDGDTVDVRTVDVDGVPTVEVEIHARLPVFGWLGPSDGLVVRGHAVVEGP